MLWLERGWPGAPEAMIGCAVNESGDESAGLGCTTVGVIDAAWLTCKVKLVVVSS